MKTKKARDLEVTYSVKEFVQKLRRLADVLERDRRFTVPAKA